MVLCCVAVYVVSMLFLVALLFLNVFMVCCLRVVFVLVSVLLRVLFRVCLLVPFDKHAFVCLQFFVVQFFLLFMVRVYLCVFGLAVCACCSMYVCVFGCVCVVF